MSRKQYYLDFFGEDKEYNINPARLEKNLIDYLSTNFPCEKIKNSPPGNQRIKDNMEIAALCYAAAEIKCATPIVMYPQMFRFSICIERYISKKKIEDRLEDYPFMHLAVRCGRKSIPALKQLIFDPENHENRLIAIAVLMKIDPQEARGAALKIQDDLSPEMRSILLSYLENPEVAPWDMFAMFSSRGRAMMEHARRGSRY
ncbi:MAG: hypothetical protein JXR73_06930 [Candidatus Omnitrophica bacterium]|nr:hypothetical protein [Candidatus Omnitrophota bacterium]